MLRSPKLLEEQLDAARLLVGLLAGLPFVWRCM
jgi:hypothetical protein